MLFRVPQRVSSKFSRRGFRLQELQSVKRFQEWTAKTFLRIYSNRVEAPCLSPTRKGAVPSQTLPIQRAQTETGLLRRLRVACSAFPSRDAQYTAVRQPYFETAERMLRNLQRWFCVMICLSPKLSGLFPRTIGALGRQRRLWEGNDRTYQTRF